MDDTKDANRRVLRVRLKASTSVNKTPNKTVHKNKFVHTSTQTDSEVHDYYANRVYYENRFYYENRVDHEDRDCSVDRDDLVYRENREDSVVREARMDRDVLVYRENRGDSVVREARMDRDVLVYRENRGDSVVREGRVDNDDRVELPAPKWTVLLFKTICFIGLFIFLGACMSATKDNELGFPYWNKPVPGMNESNQLEMEILKLQKEYPKISEETLFRLSSSVEWILSKEEPRHPSSIVVLLPPEHNSVKIATMERLVEDYAVMVNRIFEKMLKTKDVPVFHMDQLYFKKIGGRLAKIKDDLKLYFEQGGRSVVVRDIDKITNDKELMVFHALCDDTMAPEKRALVIFLVPVPDSIASRELWTEERSNDIALQTLDNIWAPVLSSNYRAPLMARVLRETLLVEM